MLSWSSYLPTSSAISFFLHPKSTIRSHPTVNPITTTYIYPLFSSLTFSLFFSQPIRVVLIVIFPSYAKKYIWSIPFPSPSSLLSRKTALYSSLSHTSLTFRTSHDRLSTIYSGFCKIPSTRVDR